MGSAGPEWGVHCPADRSEASRRRGRSNTGVVFAITKPGEEIQKTLGEFGFQVSFPSSMRSWSRDWVSSRETCIWERPTLAAISAWVSSPKNR